MAGDPLSLVHIQALSQAQAASAPQSGARVPLSKAPDATRTAAEEFETVFLQTMFNSMFETIEGGGTFGESNASETWRGMLAEEYAKSVVKSGGIGITEAVQRELIALQEGNNE